MDLMHTSGASCLVQWTKVSTQDSFTPVSYTHLDVYKRQTQWFSIIDKEWLRIRKTFEEWLDKTNFENGKQKRGIAAIRESLSN